MEQSPLFMREEALVQRSLSKSISVFQSVRASPANCSDLRARKSKGCERHKAAYDHAKADQNVGQVGKVVDVGECGGNEGSALTVARVQRRQEPDSAEELWRRKGLTAQDS